MVFLIPVITYFISTRQENKLEKNILNYVISSVPINDNKKESKLNEIFSDNLGDDKKYAVVIKNFETDEEFRFNDTKEYNSASLYKIWVLAVALQQIKDGILDRDEVISGDKNVFDLTLGLITPTPTPTGENPPAEAGEKEPLLISMKVSDAIEKMITESDNYAALLLTRKLGYKNIDAFVNNYRFTNSSFGSPPKTNASDIALFFELLYKNKIIDENVSSEMIELLKDQTLNDRIPKYLPKNIQVAHKTGELFGAKHDAGIVFSTSGDYIIVVLSQTENESVAAEKIARFSEDIFNYFENEN
jgi:beta-lactamase class A